MSWTETGIVVMTKPTLVIRTKFGIFHKFEGIEGYEEGEHVLLACSPTNTFIVEEHTTTIPMPPTPPEVPDVDYEDLYYVE